MGLLTVQQRGVTFRHHTHTHTYTHTHPSSLYIPNAQLRCHFFQDLHITSRRLKKQKSRIRLTPVEFLKIQIGRWPVTSSITSWSKNSIPGPPTDRKWRRVCGRFMILVSLLLQGEPTVRTSSLPSANIVTTKALIQFNLFWCLTEFLMEFENRKWHSKHTKWRPRRNDGDKKNKLWVPYKAGNFLNRSDCKPFGQQIAPCSLFVARLVGRLVSRMLK